MIRSSPSSLARAAILILSLAVVLCLVMPMTGDGRAGMHFALVCCFVLAIALTVSLLARPRRSPLLGSVPAWQLPLARAPTQRARPPDPITLGILLI